MACVPSNAQRAPTYGQVGAKKIQQTLVNKFVGKVEDSSAVYGSELLGKREQVVKASSAASSTHEGG